MEYSLSDLVKVTGAKRRTLQLWAEAGVILTEDAVHGGTGTHRRYSEREAAIACLVLPFARLQISIGFLVVIARSIRGILNGEGDGEVRWDDLEAAIADERKCFLLVSQWRGEEGVETAVTLHAVEDEAEMWIDVGEASTRFAGLPGAITLTLLVNTHVKNLRKRS